ncbi:MAG: hypothetical protein ABGX25_04170 [Nautiliaceae bacterium]
MEEKYLINLKSSVPEKYQKIIEEFEKLESLEEIQNLAKRYNITIKGDDYKNAKEKLAYELVEFIFSELNGKDVLFE